MPAVNLPLQQTQSNVTLTLSLVPKGYLRLLCIIGLPILGLLLLALRFTSRARYKSYQRALLHKVDPNVTTQQRFWIPEKSRGVSNQKSIMSFNQASGITQSASERGLSQGQNEGHRDGSEERGSRGNSREDMKASPSIDEGMPLVLRSGPPPPPPLTPPTLSTGVFTFQDRRLSVAASTVASVDTNFFHQPNPDYSSPSSSGSTSAAFPHSQESPSTPTPRRRSYTKVLPLGPSHASHGDDEASFSPSSFPSSSPILPLAPHESLEPREIGVKGEIISVMDDSGAGWKRHTRVYGGGVCLACMASGDQGGFYGDNVPPEHRR
ncbi:hypothetical protein F4779DRAFT_90133 [Xylariaceae sp. FL0662B]|nr:hypothetical protein F4779DRAFT_90133 [Xylariaceae sp. FL0662B]